MKKTKKLNIEFSKLDGYYVIGSCPFMKFVFFLTGLIEAILGCGFVFTSKRY